MLKQLGWDEAWATALAAVPRSQEMEPARVTAVHRGLVRVVGNDIDLLVPVAGSVEVQPVVGDWIALGSGAVRAVLPRRTTLSREDGPLAANVDLAVIVTSLNQDLNVRRIERFATLVRGGGIEPLVALSKGDLNSDPVAAADEVAGHLGGTEVLVFSAEQGWGVPALRSRLRPGKTSVLVGMSGVGKSTLVNLLLGEEVQRVLDIRDRDDRGRHATTHRELFVLDDGALLIDTPGVRRPALATAEGVDETFADVTELALGCKFSDCRHEDEPGCAVRGVVAEERLASMRKLEREGWDATIRKARGRQGSKLVREALRMKGRDR